VSFKLRSLYPRGVRPQHPRGYKVLDNLNEVTALTPKRNSHPAFLKDSVSQTEDSRQMRRRWVDNIKMDLTEIGWGGRDSILC
jgi:hypothetical protein